MEWGKEVWIGTFVLVRKKVGKVEIGKRSGR